MHKLIRLTLSGMMGLLIVAALFVLMGFLIDSNRHAPKSTQLTDQKITFKTLLPKTMAETKTTEVTKPKKERPNNKQQFRCN